MPPIPDTSYSEENKKSLDISSRHHFHLTEHLSNIYLYSYRSNLILTLWGGVLDYPVMSNICVHKVNLVIFICLFAETCSFWNKKKYYFLFCFFGWRGDDIWAKINRRWTRSPGNFVEYLRLKCHGACRHNSNFHPFVTFTLPLFNHNHHHHINFILGWDYSDSQRTRR